MEHLVNPMVQFDDEPNEKCELHYRPIQQYDKANIKYLHEQWFPVEYTDEFYEAVVRNVTISNQPLYSCVCQLVDNEYTNDEESYITPKGRYDYSPWQRLADSVGIDDLSDNDIPPPMTLTLARTTEKRRQENWVENDVRTNDCNSIDVMDHDTIAACVIGSFCNTVTRSKNRTVETLIRNPEKHTSMFYIMTLGTAKEYRNLGLGSNLIQSCVKLVQNNPNCGALYLHVITYNHAAIRFYEKMGFYRMDEIEDYYNINGKTYSCYLYARFFHGNRPTILKILSHFWNRFISPLIPINIGD